MSAVAVHLDCGCWASSSYAEVAGDRLVVSCLRHNVQPVVSRPDVLDVVILEVRQPTAAVPRDTGEAWL